MEPPVREEQTPSQPPTQSAATVEELHLLIEEMDDELSSYRWREAIWISIVFHVLLFLSAVFAPKWWPQSGLVLPVVPANNKDATFLSLPKDQQQVSPPKTDIISDKNRIAQSRHPVLDKDLLRKLLNAQQPGAPKAQPPAPAPQQQATQQQSSQPPGQQPAGEQNQQSPDQAQQTARMQTPPQGGGPSPFRVAPPGAAVNQAIQSMAGSHGTTHVTFRTSGDYGASRLEPRTPNYGDVEILSDTMGVDFGPYLERVKFAIQTHWDSLIPQVAQRPMMKKGKLGIQFAILKDGK